MRPIIHFVKVTANVTVDYVISDGNGGTVTNTLGWTVTGTNDVPTASAMSAVAITEQTDGATNEILLLDGAQDADVNDVLSVTNLRYQVDGLSGVAVTLDDDSKHNTELHVFAVVSGT